MVGTLPVRMLRRAALPAIALAAVLAGCSTTASNRDSSGDFKGDQRAVAKTVEDFESAARKGDQDDVCSNFLAKTLVDAYAQRGGTCQSAVDSALKNTDAFGLTVQSVRIAGSQASVRVKVDRGSKDVVQGLTLVKQGNGWRISRFG
jgi:hypothetical protein